MIETDTLSLSFLSNSRYYEQLEIVVLVVYAGLRLQALIHFLQKNSTESSRQVLIIIVDESQRACTVSSRRVPARMHCVQ